jgi:predicted nucleotidyltransferase
MALKEAFEARLNRRVDLLLSHRIHWFIRETVLQEAVPL